MRDAELAIRRTPGRGFRWVGRASVSWLRRATGMLAAIALGAPGAHAETLRGSANFDIPAQPLPSALIEFSRQADVQVMGSSSAYTNLRSMEVKGRLSSSEALRRMLRNTGLKYSIFRRAVVVNTISSARERINHTIDAGDVPGVTLDETISASRGRVNYTVPLGEMYVTGTHIRGGYPFGMQVIVLDQQDIERTGYSTTQDLVRSLPQNFNGGPSEDTNLGNEGNTSRSTGLNLRGLGAGSTLILINGRRMAPGGAQSSFVDVSTIPLAAVSRVEVLTEGASAIYGSDAVGGVVNFIMRDDYQGAETQAAFRTVTEGSLGETTASQLLGKRWEKGHLTLSYNYFQRDALRARDRAYTADSDLRRFGGSNFSSNRSNPGSLFVGGQFYAIPRNQNGVGLSPALLVPGTVNLQNVNEGRDVTAEQTLNSGFASFAQSTGSVTLSADALYSHRVAAAAQQSLNGVLTVPATNPFRVVPAGVSPAARQTIFYDFDRVIGHRVFHADVDTFSGVFSAKVKLPRRWEATTSVYYSSEDIDQQQTNNLNAAALSAALADPNPLTAFNPYADGNGTNPATLDRIRRTTFFGSDSRIRGANLMMNGGLFVLPAGEVRLAVGGDYRDQEFSTYRMSADATSRTLSPQYTRHVGAAFAEMQVPLISSRNGVPAVEHLQVSLAGRYDDYSDFGSNATPRFGIEWSPVRSLALHGSWGRSYKAPDLPTLDERTNQTVIAPVPDPQGPGGTSVVLAWLGGNSDLKAETAKTWSAGISWTPELTLNPSLDLTYYHIRFQDRIQMATEADRFLSDAARYGALTYRNPTAEQRQEVCSRGVFVGNIGPTPGDCLTAPIDVLIDLRWNNISVSKTRGLDLTGKLEWDSNYGQFGVSANMNYVLAFDEAASANASSVALVDRVSSPLRFRMVDQLTWSRDRLSATLAVNYSGSYKDNFSQPNRRVGSWTTLNVNLRYAFEETSSWLDGCSAALDVQNLFDTDPPFVNNPAGVGYDRENADPWNRMVSLRLKKEW